MDFDAWYQTELAGCSDLGMKPWLRNYEHAKSVFADMWPAPVPKQVEVGEVARLRAEIADLRRQVAAVEVDRRKDAQCTELYFKSLFGERGDEDGASILRSILARIEKLEQHDPGISAEYDDAARQLVLRWADARGGAHGQAVPLPIWRYKDVWTEGVTYEPGHATRFGGSVWLCMVTTSSKPGQDNPAWRLIVRSGRNGKDATPPKALEPACR